MAAREIGAGQRDGTLVDAAIQAIRSTIASGELAAGARMPPERVLVEQLGVSRTVVREALSSLEALGLIETRGTRGRFVSPRAIMWSMVLGSMSASSTASLTSRPGTTVSSRIR